MTPAPERPYPPREDGLSCLHEDDRGSTIMRVRDDRWECAVCGKRFRMVLSETAAPVTDAGLDVERLERVLAAIAPDVYGKFRWIAHDAACDIAAEYAALSRQAEKETA